MRIRRLVVLSLSMAAIAGMPAFADTTPPMPIVQVCLDANGQIETAEIVQTSTDADIDAAALKVARAELGVRATRAA